MDSSVIAISESEALDILRSDGVIERLKVYPESIVRGELYKVNSRMLLIVIDQTKPICEVHIAQSKINLKHIHEDIEGALTFLCKMGYNTVYTNVNTKLKSTLNLLKKHSFKQVVTIDNEVILKWE